MIELFAAVLILLAAFLTIGVGVNVASLHVSDAMGNGLAQGFAIVLAIALWLTLAILLLLCGAQGGCTGYAGSAMLLTFFVALTGQAKAIELLAAAKREGTAGTVLRAVTVAAPLLAIARAVWGIFAPARAFIPELVGSWSPILLLFLISLVPFSFRPRRGYDGRIR